MLALGLNTWFVQAETRDADGDHVIRLPGGDMNVLEQGPPDAPTVVLLHGTAGSTTWWDPVMAEVSDLHVVRIDLLGHGGSAKPGDGYGIAQQARRIAAVLDKLGVAEATVVGHSTGGAVAISLAEQREDLVSQLGLIDSGPAKDAYQGGGAIAELSQTPVIGHLLWHVRSDDRIRSALESAWARDIDVPGQIIQDVLGMTYTSFTETTEASLDFLEERSLPGRLADLRVPTLVIFGTEDERWLPSSAEDYRGVAGVRLERLGGIGHTPMFEAPGRTGSLIRNFVDQRPERP